MTLQRSDASLAALLLVQRLVTCSVEPLKASEYWSLLDRVDDPAALLGASATDVAASTGVPAPEADRIAELLDAAPAVAFEVERLEQTGLRVVTSLDDAYPERFVQRLGAAAPPAVYAVGDLGLARHDLLGIVGSRHVDIAGAETTRQAMHRAARHGFGVVTGAAKGVDQIAMNAAIDDGVAVVGVLADSLLRATRDPSVRRAITDGQLCLCTPYKPSVGFSVANAMGRNKLVYALSAATLVVAAQTETGGTWAGAVEGLRRRIAPVLAWTGEGSMAGNRRLVGLGATAVDTLDGLFPLPDLPSGDPPEDAEQLALEV